jgi:cyclase
VRYVVISQNHGDHQGGTPLFAPPAHVIIQDRVFQDWAASKPYQIKAWQRRFAERAEALKGVKPIDTAISFNERMTLHLGGKRIELIYIDEAYNPGDVAVWLPDSSVMHAGFVGYRDRHPDIRPDYSHGTTWGMLKQLEVLSALKPNIVVPAHGPLGDVTDLHALIDYLLLGREKVRNMMAKRLPLAEIEKQFNMDEYKGWDRNSHYPWMAETIYRELQGLPPQIVPISEHTVSGTIAKIAEEGRFLTTKSDAGQEIRLRTAGDTVFEGVADRSELKVGMKFTAQYMVPQGANAALGYDVMEFAARN